MYYVIKICCHLQVSIDKHFNNGQICADGIGNDAGWMGTVIRKGPKSSVDKKTEPFLILLRQKIKSRDLELNIES